MTKIQTIFRLFNDWVLRQRQLYSGGGTSSVTRLGFVLHFGQLFKANGNNYFAQISHNLGIFCKVVKILHFASEIIFGQLL